MTAANERRPHGQPVHTLSVEEYSWPADGDHLAERAANRWAETVAALPVGAEVTGQVVGRQPFGVFVEIVGVPNALGLAEITTMPRDVVLPPIGTTVHGKVLDHAAHNHQVRLRLRDQ